MLLRDIQAMLYDLGVQERLFLLSFPKGAPDVSAMITVQPGALDAPQVGDLILTVFARAPLEEDAELMAVNHRKLINGVTNYNLPDTQIILIRSQGKVPRFAGEDEKGLIYYENNFRLLTADC